MLTSMLRFHTYIHTHIRIHICTTIKYIFNFIFPLSGDARTLAEYTPETLHTLIPKAIVDLRTLVFKEDIEGDIHDVHAVWVYKHPLARTVIWELKYNGNTHARACAGYALSRYLHEKMSGKSTQKISNRSEQYIFIPIPLSKKRRRERGYNQSEWLTEEIQKHLPQIIIQKNTLIRPIHRDRQTKKGRDERIQNASELFLVKKPELIRDKVCIVIDDVLTTGSTFKSARDTLLEAGAQRVICLAVAH